MSAKSIDDRSLFADCHSSLATAIGVAQEVSGAHPAQLLLACRESREILRSQFDEMKVNAQNANIYLSVSNFHMHT